MRKQTADKLAPWLAGWLQANQGTGAPNGAATLRPLFDDLQSAEWFLEARAAAGSKPDVAIAIKLTPARGQAWQAWQAALKPYFPSATFTQSGGWLIFDSGTGTTKTGDSLARKLATPPAGWLSVDINWPRLAQWYPELKSLALPETLFNVAAADANFQITGKFFFPENLSIKLDPWQFPSNTVHQPFISFTAVRGFAGWLNGQDWAQPIKLSPPANQMFTWTMRAAPFQCFAAIPVTDASAELHQLGNGLQTVMTDRSTHGGLTSPYTLDIINSDILLMGTPFIYPYIKTLTEPSGQFLFAGGFPNASKLKSKPLPPELFQRLATPNLVFYHWEITAERLPQQLNLSQLVLFLTQHKQLEDDSAAYKWAAKIGPSLGNTDTEIIQAAPDQFAFMRKTPGGLTALELLSLATWLEATNFPNCDLSLPPISDQGKQLRAKHPKSQVISSPTH
ncbi:MAG TPA: hypothetical protein VG347_10435 [Verrucomicrobiae bacterium]|nr:hypothetical protein [Verrucomicrobiae bacterium]